MSDYGGWGSQAPPAPTGWLTVDQAAEQLGYGSRYLGNRAAEGHVASVRHGRRRWIAQETVDQILADRADWMTYIEACELIGISHTALTRLIKAGALVSRGTSRDPSISRKSAEAYVVVHQREVARVEARRRAREEARYGPPRDGQVWLDTTTAALLLELTPNRVRQLSVAGRVPFTVRSGHRWYRRDHIEQLAAARAFRARR